MNLTHMDGQAEEGQETPNLPAIHERVLLGDSAANEELAQVLLPWLCHELFKEFFHTDPDLISDAATKAIMSYLASPANFDPVLGTRLDLFVLGAARNKLKNMLRSESCRRTMEAKAAAEPPCNFPEASAWADGGRLEAEKICEAVRQGLGDPRDRELFSLWLGGERHTTPFAVLMGITNVALPLRAALVHRKKDRFRKLLQRVADECVLDPVARASEDQSPRA